MFDHSNELLNFLARAAKEYNGVLSLLGCFWVFSDEYEEHLKEIWVFGFFFPREKASISFLERESKNKKIRLNMKFGAFKGLLYDSFWLKDPRKIRVLPRLETRSRFNNPNFINC